MVNQSGSENYDIIYLVHWILVQNFFLFLSFIDCITDYLNAKAKRFSRYRISELIKVAGTAIENHLIIIQAKLYPSFLTMYFTILPVLVNV